VPNLCKLCANTGNTGLSLYVESLATMCQWFGLLCATRPENLCRLVGQVVNLRPIVNRPVPCEKLCGADHRFLWSAFAALAALTPAEARATLVYA